MPTTSLTLPKPTRKEAQQAKIAFDALSQGQLELTQLPRIVQRILSHALDEIAQGRAVSVVPVETDVTTSQAADLLNVSRPYLVRLLDEGQIAFHRVGSHRRIRLRDVEAYKQKQDQDSDAALAELQAQAQDLNMGYGGA